MKKKCVLCKKTYIGYGSNPYPLSSKGRACKHCDDYKVIPTRMAKATGMPMGKAVEIMKQLKKQEVKVIKRLVKKKGSLKKR